MSMRVGTLLSPTSTGNEDFDTGLGIAPAALWMQTACTEAGDDLLNELRTCIGATDGTNQWSSASAIEFDDVTPAVNSDDFFTVLYVSDKVISAIDATSTVVLEAEIVSFNNDGTITLNWTTVQGTAFQVGWVAWAGLTAQAGTTTLPNQNSLTTVTTGFESKVVMGSNVANVNDGTFSAGFVKNGAAAPIDGFDLENDGTGFCQRVNILPNWRYEFAQSNPYSWLQADVIGGSVGTFTNFDATGFDIDTTSTNISWTNNDVGWLALGEGGSWFCVTSDLDVDTNFPAFGVVPIGCMTFRDEPAIDVTADSHAYTSSWGAWDRQDNQWCAAAVGLDQFDPAPATTYSIVSRGFWDDRVSLSATAADLLTINNYETLALQPGAHQPLDTVHGSPTPDFASTGLFFVYQGGERFWAWLV